jgi:hypothetical protein
MRIFSARRRTNAEPLQNGQQRVLACGDRSSVTVVDFKFVSDSFGPGSQRSARTPRALNPRAKARRMPPGLSVRICLCRLQRQLYITFTTRGAARSGLCNRAAQVEPERLVARVRADEVECVRAGRLGLRAHVWRQVREEAGEEEEVMRGRRVADVPLEPRPRRRDLRRYERSSLSAWRRAEVKHGRADADRAVHPRVVVARVELARALEQRALGRPRVWREHEDRLGPAARMQPAQEHAPVVPQPCLLRRVLHAAEQQRRKRQLARGAEISDVHGALPRVQRRLVRGVPEEQHPTQREQRAAVRVRSEPSRGGEVRGVQHLLWDAKMPVDERERRVRALRGRKFREELAAVARDDLERGSGRVFGDRAGQVMVRRTRAGLGALRGRRPARTGLAPYSRSSGWSLAGSSPGLRRATAQSPKRIRHMIHHAGPVTYKVARAKVYRFTREPLNALLPKFFSLFELTVCAFSMHSPPRYPRRLLSPSSSAPCVIRR